METVLIVEVAVGMAGIGGVLWKLVVTSGQIHKLVNSRLTEALDDIAALKKALLEERRSSELAAITRASKKKG